MRGEYCGEDWGEENYVEKEWLDIADFMAMKLLKRHPENK